MAAEGWDRTGTCGEATVGEATVGDTAASKAGSGPQSYWLHPFYLPKPVLQLPWGLSLPASPLSTHLGGEEKGKCQVSKFNGLQICPFRKKIPAEMVFPSQLGSKVPWR